MGAVTYPFGAGVEAQAIVNDKRGVRVLVAPSTSYSTGGDTIPLSTLGLKTIDKLYVDTSISATSGISVRLQGTPNAPLLQIYDANNTEVANASNNAARVVGLLFLGT